MRGSYCYVSKKKFAPTRTSKTENPTPSPLHPCLTFEREGVGLLPLWWVGFLHDIYCRMKILTLFPKVVLEIFIHIYCGGYNSSTCRHPRLSVLSFCNQVKGDTRTWPSWRETKKWYNMMNQHPSCFLISNFCSVLQQIKTFWSKWIFDILQILLQHVKGHLRKFPHQLATPLVRWVGSSCTNELTLSHSWAWFDAILIQGMSYHNPRHTLKTTNLPNWRIWWNLCFVA